MTSTASTEVARLSAGIVVVNERNGAFRYLLLRSYRYWDFPKGLVEEGETPLTAARRETREETGLSEFDFRRGNIYVETEPYAGGKVARYYVAAVSTAEVKLGVNKLLGKPEHQEYKWLSYGAARGLLVPRVCAVLDWAHRVVDGT